MVYIAYAHGDPYRRTYVGVYLWPIRGDRPTDILMLDGMTSPGVVMTSADQPLMKMLLFPMPDGSIRATYGFIQGTVDDGSFGNQGVIDPDAGETLYFANRRVEGVPALADPFWGTAGDPEPCYSIAHDDDQWWVAPCWRSKTVEWTSQGFIRVLPEATCEVHQPISPQEWRRYQELLGSRNSQ